MNKQNTTPDWGKVKEWLQQHNVILNCETKVSVEEWDTGEDGIYEVCAESLFLGDGELIFNATYDPYKSSWMYFITDQIKEGEQELYNAVMKAIENAK